MKTFLQRMAFYPVGFLAAICYIVIVVIAKRREKQ